MMVEEFTTLPHLSEFDGVVPTADLDMDVDFNAFAAQIQSDGSQHALPSPSKARSIGGTTSILDFGDLGMLSASELFQFTASTSAPHKATTQPQWGNTTSPTPVHYDAAATAAAVAATLPAATHFLQPAQGFVGLLPLLSECTSAVEGGADTVLMQCRGATPTNDMDSPVSYVSADALFDERQMDAEGRSSAAVSDIEAISDALSDSDGESSSYGSGLSSAGASPVYGVALSTPHHSTRYSANTTTAKIGVVGAKAVKGGANKCVKEARKGWKCSADFMVKSITGKERIKLVKQGITPPPPGVDGSTLTKATERELRTALRKIRNVQSAQKSRRNQKDYIATLESEAAVREAAMDSLETNVAELAEQNSTLLAQLAQFRRMVTGGGTGTALLMLAVGCGIAMPGGGSGGDGAAMPIAVAAATSFMGGNPSSASFAPAGFQARTLSGLASSDSTNGYGLQAAAAGGAWGWTAGIIAMALVLAVVALVVGLVGTNSVGVVDANNQRRSEGGVVGRGTRQDSSEVEEQPVVELDYTDETDSDDDAVAPVMA